MITMPLGNSSDRRPAARILIVDDHPVVREALAIRIGAEPDLEVCGEAADLEEALHAAASTRPDVAVIDLSLKYSSGIDLIKKLKAKHRKLLIIVWSMYSEDLYAERVLRAGARGYINKEQATGKIIEAIRQVLNGSVYLSPALTERPLERAIGRSTRTRSPRYAINLLSNRELDVLRLIGQGLKTSEIAAQLHLSKKTVETYRDRIREKLTLSDGAELSRFAMRWEMESE
jgi:DNA-binding NarL/FixJ family response regulator